MVAANFSGHSGPRRLGGIRRQAGASHAATMSVKRHKYPTMVARYGKAARQRLASTHRFKGMGGEVVLEGYGFCTKARC